MKKVLLVGGEGYIGNIVSQKLLTNGYHIISYDNLMYHNHICVLNKNHFDTYNFVFGDMLEKDKLEKLIGEVDCVVLLAGLVGDPITKKYPVESSKINDTLSEILNLFNSEVNWRKDASKNLMPELEKYNLVIKDNIGLRRQSRLTIEQAKMVASCNAVHRDISLNF